MQTAGPEDFRREAQLLLPVVDDRTPEEALRPAVHLPRNLGSNTQEPAITVNRQREVALVVQRHGADLPERIFTVEHPAIGARQERVRDIANALVERDTRFRGGAGPLNPLPLQIPRNLS